MARTAVAITALTRTGVTAGAATTSALAGHVLASNAGRTFLEIVSSDAGAQYVDVQIVQTIDEQPTTAKRISVAAGARVKAGPFPTNIYNQLVALAAGGTLTSDATAPADGDTVTIDGSVYTFKTALTATANQVLIGGTAATALANLKKAINLAGVAGTDYGTGTAVHPTVSAGTLTSTTLQVTAKTSGTAGNAIATTETSAHLSWSAATLAGGFAAGTVLLDPSVAATLSLTAFSV